MIQKKIQYGDTTIEYTIIHRSRKTVGINVSRDGGVRVLAPKGITQRQIKDIVTRKAPWIIQKLKDMHELKMQIPERKFLEGERLLFLGETYSLKIHQGVRQPKGRAVLQGNEIHVYLPGPWDGIQVRNVLLEWYREQADRIFRERTAVYSKALGIYPNRVVIKEQKTRWGSCSSKGNLNLNWKLVMAPMEVLDYVVVHELSHLIEMNHSKAFWGWVGKILPDYAQRKKWLKDHGATLML